MNKGTSTNGQQPTAAQLIEAFGELRAYVANRFSIRLHPDDLRVILRACDERRRLEVRKAKRMGRVK